MLRSFLVLLALGALPVAMSAQGQTPSGTEAEALSAALRHARRDLIDPRRHVSVDLWMQDAGHAWSASAGQLFRATLAADDSSRAGVEVCDSRVHPCRLDETSEVVALAAPAVRGDTISVTVYRTRWQRSANPRVRWSLRGNQYTLVRRGSHWVVVRSDLVAVT